MGWAARVAYLTAKFEQKQVELYAMDLLWLVAKHYYGELPQPSDMYLKHNKKDTRSGAQILDDLMKELGGE